MLTASERKAGTRQEFGEREEDVLGGVAEASFLLHILMEKCCVPKVDNFCCNIMFLDNFISFK